jgi:hypothetical protein
MLDWQTEEGQTWDEKPQPQTAVSPWPRRFIKLLLILLLAGGTWGAANLLQQQIETATGETEADLRHAYGLLRQAAERQDADLFNLLLSGRDVEWARAQEQLLREGQLLDRPTWGLVHRPELGAADPVTEIVLSPDLLSAELTAVEPYQFWSIADQQVKTARLQHTAVYRLGPDRWLYAPPEPDFWGDTLEVRSDTLHLTYPERDHEVVEQLFPNLSALMANTCRLPGFYCRAVRVEFGTDPASLAQSLTHVIVNPDEPLLLPAPTLLGVPRDGAGYELLWLAYGRHLSSMLITQQTHYRCCRQAVYYQTLLHYQLAQLNLHDWPLPQAAAREPYAGHVPIDDLYNQTIFLDSTHSSFVDLNSLTDVLETGGDLATITFRQMPPALQTTYTLIDYLVAGHDLTPSDLQRQLNSHSHLLDWFNEVSLVPAQSAEHLLLLLADHITTQRPDVAHPPGPLTITCTPRSPALRLSYDPATRAWQERPLPPLPAVLTKDGWRLPAAQEVIATGHADFYLLRTSDTTYLATTDWLYPIEWDGGLPINIGTLQVTSTPDGRLFNLTWKRLLRSQHFTYYYLLEPDTCDETGCLAERIPGEVLWSPNGRYSLISVSEGQSETPGLYLGDAGANIQLFLADHFDRLTPVWLDDEHFAYPTLTDEDAVQFIIQSLSASQVAAGSQPLTIGADQLTNLLPDERDPLRPVQPIQLIVSQDNPTHLLLLAARPWVRDQVGSGVSYEQYHLFWLQLTADFSQIESLSLRPLSGGAPLLGQINPQGNNAIAYTSLDSINLIISMFDRPSDAPGPGYTTWPFAPMTAAAAPAWSPDGEWLAITYPFGLLLTNAPTFDLVHLAPYDLANCFHSQWSR